MTERPALDPDGAGRTPDDLGAAEDRCHRCGAERPDGAWDWSREATEGRVTWLCPGCARRHVRDIEAKLAPEWW